jgi:hypothetical protein
VPPVEIDNTLVTAGKRVRNVAGPTTVDLAERPAPAHSAP